MKLSESIALHTPATKRVLKAGGVGSGPQLPAIQREIAQRMANHLKVVTVHTPSQSHFSPTPKLATPGKVGHGGSAPKAPSGGPKMTPSAPRPGGKIGAGGPGSGPHADTGGSKLNRMHAIVKGRGYTKVSRRKSGGAFIQHVGSTVHKVVTNSGGWSHESVGGPNPRGLTQGSSVASLREHLNKVHG